MSDDVSLRKTTDAEPTAQHGDMRPRAAHDGARREAAAPARAQIAPDEAGGTTAERPGPGLYAAVKAAIDLLEAESAPALRGDGPTGERDDR